MEYLDCEGNRIVRGDTFRLIGRNTEFIATNLYMAAGDIPAVVGWSLDGSYTTCARTADVIFLGDN